MCDPLYVKALQIQSAYDYAKRRYRHDMTVTDLVEVEAWQLWGIELLNGWHMTAIAAERTLHDRNKTIRVPARLIIDLFEARERKEKSQLNIEHDKEPPPCIRCGEFPTLSDTADWRCGLLYHDCNKLSGCPQIWFGVEEWERKNKSRVRTVTTKLKCNAGVSKETMAPIQREHENFEKTLDEIASKCSDSAIEKAMSLKKSMMVEEEPHFEIGDICDSPWGRVVILKTGLKPAVLGDIRVHILGDKQFTPAGICCVSSHVLTLAKEPFRAGDRVRVVYPYGYTGEIGTVIRVYGSQHSLGIDLKMNSGACTSFSNPKSIEHAFDEGDR